MPQDIAYGELVFVGNYPVHGWAFGHSKISVFVLFCLYFL
jgi:hypothetical protein